MSPILMAYVGTAWLICAKNNIKLLDYMNYNFVFSMIKSTQKATWSLVAYTQMHSPARLFTNRILCTVLNAPTVGREKPDRDFHKDIKWFTTFLETFNGSVHIHNDCDPTKIIFVDASSGAMGVKLGNKVYSLPIPSSLKQICTIMHLEAVNIVVALHTWSTILYNNKCTAYCDSMAVVECFTSHKICDPFLMAYVGTAWLICAKNNIKLLVKLIPGHKNKYADISSRCQYHNDCKVTEVQLLT